MRAAVVQPRIGSGARVKTALLTTTLLALGTVPASAQETIQTLPGVDRFQLPPGNSQQPAPTPTPVATPTPAAPPPVVRTVPTPTPTPSRTPAPRPTATATGTSTPAATPVRSVDPTPVPVAPATASPDTVSTPSPTPSPAPTPEAAAAPDAIVAPSSGPPTWVLWLLGLGLVGAVAAAVLAWRRRSTAPDDLVYVPVPPPPAPPAPTPTPTPTPTPAPGPAKPTIGIPAATRSGAVPATTPSAPVRALAFDFRPQRLWTRGPNAYLAFELLLTNASTTALSGIRPVVTLASAGPDTAAELAGFAAQVASLPAAEPFDLRAGETRKIAGELTLPGDAMHVTTVAEREMIVPVAMVGAAWRGGLSVASAAEAFVIGAGDATAAKLGPVWVDRPGQIYGRLDARRFTPR